MRVALRYLAVLTCTTGVKSSALPAVVDSRNVQSCGGGGGGGGGGVWLIVSRGVRRFTFIIELKRARLGTNIGKMPSFHQDRLGTNMGKTHRDVAVFYPGHLHRADITRLDKVDLKLESHRRRAAQPRTASA